MIEDKKDGVKIASKEEKFWLEVKAKCEEGLLAHERNRIIDENLLELAKFKIKEHKLK
jgi:hypothetical protein